jgi:hypothetical protein
MMKSRVQSLIVSVLAILAGVAPRPAAAAAPVVRSRQSGLWSAAGTRDGGRVPAAGAVVLVRQGHAVVYDIAAADVIRAVHVAGTLTFADDRDTRLDVGLIKVRADADLREEGFESPAHAHQKGAYGAANAHSAADATAALSVGTPDKPIRAGRSATIRLHHVAGMDPKLCPAIVCDGGRLEFHGASIGPTWVKLGRTAKTGDARLVLGAPVARWRVGDRVIVTATTTTHLDEPIEATRESETEERTIVSLKFREGEPSIVLNRPLRFEHFAEGRFRAEVANLSRNVVVESAAPDGERGHTMYHRGSTGSIAFAEFRHLGKKGVLGRYSLHYHLAGDTMRGSSIVGASIWDSHNRWVTVHGTNYLVVRDVVGYGSVGHGFFLEDATETLNVFDHNLAVRASEGKPLPGQILAFDKNRGAGFWWANSLNAFTGNVAADCDEYAYRFDSRKTADFDARRSILLPDGTEAVRDVRVQPFIRFEDNEVHSQRLFGLNLRGIERPSTNRSFYEWVKSGEAGQAHPTDPFVIRNLKVWDTRWPFHAGTTGVLIDGLDVYRSTYGIWRSVIDRHTYKNLTMREIGHRDIHMPISLALPDGTDDKRSNYFRGIGDPVDDQPPTTVVTHVRREAGGVVVRGTTVDDGTVASVLVNGSPAYALRPNFAEWELHIPAMRSTPITISSGAEDAAGNAEKRLHVLHLSADE